MEEWAEKQILEHDRRINAHDRALVELTKAINNGLRGDVTEILTTLKSMKKHVHELEKSAWFLTWINKARDNMFKTVIKSVLFMIIFLFICASVGEKGVAVLKKVFGLMGG